MYGFALISEAHGSYEAKQTIIVTVFRHSEGIRNIDRVKTFNSYVVCGYWNLMLINGYRHTIAELYYALRDIDVNYQARRHLGSDTDTPEIKPH